jgi:hypothetical protein
MNWEVPPILKLDAWPLCKEVRVLVNEREQMVKTDAGKNIIFIEGRAVMAGLIDIAAVICKECNGYGHHRKICPTYTKVQAFTDGNKTFKSLVNRAREQNQLELMKGTLGNV